MPKGRKKKGQSAADKCATEGHLMRGSAGAEYCGRCDVALIGPARERSKPERLSEDSIVAKFAEAMKPVPPPKVTRRWPLPVTLAVIVVAGALAGAGWMDAALQPTIFNLKSDLTSLGRRYHMALVDRARIEDKLGKKVDDQHLHIRQLKEQNGLLIEHYNDLFISDFKIRRDAGRDVERAEDAVQTWQTRDQLDDRGQAAQVLRALERAEQRLKSAP